MRELTISVVDDIRQSFGSPIKVSKLLAKYPSLIMTLEEPQRSISAYSTVPWHEFGYDFGLTFPRKRKGVLTGWKWSGYWHSFSVQREEYDRIEVEKTQENWTVDITAIDGFGASKEDLRLFESVDEMAKRTYKNLIEDISVDGLKRCLSHHGIALIHNPKKTTDFFFTYAWDGRLWLSNTDGSHHTAAAQYIARRLKKPVPLTGRLRTYEINGDALRSLFSDYEVFAVDMSDPFAACAFNDAMKDIRATWLWHHLPKPYHGNGKAVFFPKNDRRSMLVASEFRRAGGVDLAAFLLSLASPKAMQ